MDYYPAIRKNKILIHATAQQNPEDSLLSEMSQTQKEKYCTVPLTGGNRSFQVQREAK